MVIKILVVTSAIISITSSTATSYQYVKFLKSNNGPTKKIHSLTSNGNSRIQRSFNHFPTDLIILPDDFPTEILFPDKNFYDFSLGRHDHLTPDYSNGLDYPDPYLVVGPAAHKAVAYLYSKELFFHEIPHVRSILKLQEVRHQNGLPRNRLGSLRKQSPFCRYRCTYYA